MTDPRPCEPAYVMIPGALLWSGISARAVHLWAVLEGHQRDKPNAYPSQQHLAEDIGSSPKSVRTAAAELEAAGWIRIDHGGGGRSNNVYTVVGSPRQTGTGDGRPRPSSSERRAKRAHGDGRGRPLTRDREQETSGRVRTGVQNARENHAAANDPPSPRRCPTHQLDMPCRGCRADRLAGDGEAA